MPSHLVTTNPRWALNVRRWTFAFLGLALAVAVLRADIPRGGRVGWARLVTESGSWSVHSQNDPILARFIHDHTSLNIDPRCYPVDPADLNALCTFPFVFTNNLTNVHRPQRLANLREYLRRGGFIYIDRCVNLSFSLPQETFYDRHMALFASLLPEAKIRELSADEPIFRCYFDVTARARDGSHTGHDGMYGVFLDGRLAVVLSNKNLQCGWPGAPARQMSGMQTIANIYIYAMTRLGDP
jgi:hypothetical protein